MTETPLATPAHPALRLTRRAGFVLGGGAVLLLAILFAVSVGAVAVPLSTVWGVLANKLIPGLVTPDWTPGREAIVWDIRFPRALLAALVRSRGRPLSRAQLIDRALGRDAEVTDRAVDVQVARLRRAIGDPADAPELIKTVWGVGYVLVSDGA